MELTWPYLSPSPYVGFRFDTEEDVDESRGGKEDVCRKHVTAGYNLLKKGQLIKIKYKSLR